MSPDCLRGVLAGAEHGRSGRAPAARSPAPSSSPRGTPSTRRERVEDAPRDARRLELAALEPLEVPGGLGLAVAREPERARPARRPAATSSSELRSRSRGSSAGSSPPRSPAAASAPATIGSARIAARSRVAVARRGREAQEREQLLGQLGALLGGRARDVLVDIGSLPAFQASMNSLRIRSRSEATEDLLHLLPPRLRRARRCRARSRAARRSARRTVSLARSTPAPRGSCRSHPGDRPGDELLGLEPAVLGIDRLARLLAQLGVVRRQHLVIRPGLAVRLERLSMLPAARLSCRSSLRP